MMVIYLDTHILRREKKGKIETRVYVCGLVAPIKKERKKERKSRDFESMVWDWESLAWCLVGER